MVTNQQEQIIKALKRDMVFNNLFNENKKEEEKKVTSKPVNNNVLFGHYLRTGKAYKKGGEF